MQDVYNSRSGAAPFCQRELDRDRDNGERDDGDDDSREVILDARDSAEEIAEKREAEDPEKSARGVVGGEPPIPHLPHAGDEGREGSHDRYEAREDDRLPAVLLVERARLVQVPLIDGDFRMLDQLPSEIPPHPVVDSVAGKGGYEEQEKQGGDIERAGGRERTRDEEERIPR